MTQDDRKEWIKIAIHEVKDMPADIFFDACAEARKVCDHPAKIIPMVSQYKPKFYGMNVRRKAYQDALMALENIDAKRLGYVASDAGNDETAEVSELIAQLVKDMQAAQRECTEKPIIPI